MESLPAVVIVAFAAVGGAGWLAELIERAALVATGPTAGQPELARAAAAALPVAGGWPAASRPAGGIRPAVRVRPAVGIRPTAGIRPTSGPAGGLRPAAGPAAVGAAAVAVGGVVAGGVGAAPELAAMLLLAGLGVVLAAVDVRAHRLPDALVLPSYPLLAFLLFLGALTGRTGLTPLVRAAEGGMVAFGVLYVLAVAVPAGFGFGDVKLTGLLGAALGWYGWPELLAGLTYAFGYGGLCAAALLLTRRLARTDRLAFGPFLLAGTLTSLWAASLWAAR